MVCIPHFDLQTRFARGRDSAYQSIGPQHLLFEHKIGGDEQRGRNAETLEHRTGLGQNIAKPIVEGDTDGAFQRAVLSFQPVNHPRERNRVVIPHDMLHQALEERPVQVKTFVVTDGVGVVRGDAVKREDDRPVPVQGSGNTVYTENLGHGVQTLLHAGLRYRGGAGRETALISTIKTHREGVLQY